MAVQKQAKVSAAQGEAARLDRIKAKAAVPDGCSDAIPLVPAAGLSVVFRHSEGVMTPSGPRSRATTIAGQHAVRRCGPLEVMEHLAARRGGKDPLVFTLGQHAAAVEYVALAEWCASSGVKLSSLEGGGGGGDTMGRMDRYCQAMARMRLMRAAIGSGVALEARVAAAHHDRGRTSLPVAAVVDGVLIEGRSIAAVLARHRWSRQTPYMKAAQAALSKALTRMYGL